jgi:hypothetical protein
MAEYETISAAPGKRGMLASGAAVAPETGSERVSGSALIGCSILDLSRSEPLGAVQEVIYDPDKGRLVGFRLERRSPFEPRRVLDFRDVARIADGAITVTSAAVVVEEGVSSEVSRAIRRGALVLGRRLFAEWGERSICVHDVLVDPHTGLGAEPCSHFFLVPADDTEDDVAFAQTTDGTADRASWR